MTDVVLREIEDGVALLTFNRPDRLNAWTAEMQTLYFDLLDDCAAREDVRAIVLTGAGRGFWTGRKMTRGEIWFAATPGGDRPVLILTRDPVAERIGSVTVAALTRTRRDLVSELCLTAAEDDVPTDCIVNFDNLHTIPRAAFRRRVTTLSPARMAAGCRALRDAVGC